MVMIKMPSVKWTEQQKLAIESRKGNILVSAAAGSGKTSVLAERIVSIITSDNPVDISRILVVTFTKSAAKDMKRKIADALNNSLNSFSNNSFLRKQLINLDKADISTIDSFYLKIVSSHFAELGMSAKMRVADETEISILKKELMDDTLNYFYNLNSKEFLRLVDNFTALRDNRLSELLVSIYNSLMSYRDNIDFILKSYNRYDEIVNGNIYESDYYKQASIVINRFIEHYKNSLALAFNKLDITEENPKFLSIIRKEIKDLEILLAEKETNKKIYLINNLTFERLPPNREKSEEYELFKSVRETFKEDLKNFKNKSWVNSENNINVTFADDTKFILRSLYDVLKRFDGIYQKEKKNKSLFDFSDLQRYTYDLLIKDGQKTDFAKVVAENYDYIFIDEFQDSNDIQDAIFSSISKENRMMVGDIKQSIYSFRGAVPEIFNGYRENYPDYNISEYNESGKIFLSHNFRSTKEIIKFDNLVFNKLFTSNSGNILYEPVKDGLIYPFEDGNNSFPVSVDFLINDTLESNTKAEAVYVSEKIKHLIELGRKPGEIVILLRNAFNKDEIFKNELENRGIPVETVKSDDFFEEPEILLLLSLLGAIDNPLRDIYLAGAMKSPFFNIDLNVLLELKQGEKSLYDRLIYASENGSTSFRDFIVWLNNAREYSINHTVSELVNHIIDTLSYKAIISNGKKDVIERINSFYYLSCQYESNGLKGLHNFIRYINDLRKSGKSPELLSDKNQSDSVKIMTIHKSKGLEFPIVFICGLASKINSSDINSDILINRALGIGFKIVSEDGTKKYGNLMTGAISSKIEDDMVDEEIRILYVAMTRAKEQMYLISSSKNINIIEKASQSNLDFYYLIKSKNNIISWVLSSLPSLNSNDIYSINILKSSELIDTNKIYDNNGITIDDNKTDSDHISLFRKRIEYIYPYKKYMDLPLKESVSELYPLYNESETIRETDFQKKPEFLDSEKYKGSDYGNANHLFMQFCNFDNIVKYGTEYELKRLNERGFLKNDISKLVNIKKIDNFIKSELFNEIINSKEIYREKRFLVSVPYSLINNEYNNYNILVQGVIDCFYKINNNFKLIDYKTDNLLNIDNKEDYLKSKYYHQLRYYKYAVEKMTGVSVSEASIYSFYLEKEIKII